MTTSQFFIEFSDGEEWSIDAVETFSLSFRQTATQLYIEDGAKISDHVSSEPLTASISGIQVDVPWSMIKPGQPNYYEEDSEGLHRQFIERVERAANTAEFIIIDAGTKGLYEDIIILDLTENHDNEHGEAIPFTLQLEQLLVAQTETRKLPPKQENNELRARMAVPQKRGLRPGKGAGGGRAASSQAAVADTTFPGSEAEDFVRGQ